METELVTKIEEVKEVEEPKEVEVIKITHDPVVEEKTKSQIMAELKNLEYRKEAIEKDLEKTDLEIEKLEGQLSMFSK